MQLADRRRPGGSRRGKSVRSILTRAFGSPFSDSFELAKVLAPAPFERCEPPRRRRYDCIVPAQSSRESPRAKGRVRVVRGPLGNFSPPRLPARLSRGAASQKISRGPARHERSPRTFASHARLPRRGTGGKCSRVCVAIRAFLRCPSRARNPRGAIRGLRSCLAGPRLISRGVPPGQNAPKPPQLFPASFAHASFSVIVRLNTSRPGALSGSSAK